jgi:hypothetical protein
MGSKRKSRAAPAKGNALVQLGSRYRQIDNVNTVIIRVREIDDEQSGGDPVIRSVVEGTDACVSMRLSMLREYYTQVD